MDKENIIEAGELFLKAPNKINQSDNDIEAEYNFIRYEEPEVNPSKTGPKPKQLTAVEVFGYQVGLGKTKKVVFPDDVYRLAAIGSTDREIAKWFGIQEDTLRNNFSEIMEKGREEIRQSLRQAQLKLALSGNPTMLIWLGKNLLGQTDNPIDSTANQPLPWKDEDI